MGGVCGLVGWIVGIGIGIRSQEGGGGEISAGIQSVLVVEGVEINIVP